MCFGVNLIEFSHTINYKRPELIMARTYSGVLLLITKKIDIFANTNFTT